MPDDRTGPSDFRASRAAGRLCDIVQSTLRARSPLMRRRRLPSASPQSPMGLFESAMFGGATGLDGCVATARSANRGIASSPT